MSQPFADYRYGDTCLEGEGGVRVAKVVEPDLAEARALHDSLERLAERMRMDGLALLLRDHQVVILIVGAPFETLVFLATSVIASPRSHRRGRLRGRCGSAGSTE